jgi:hypothetical protein
MSDDASVGRIAERLAAFDKAIRDWRDARERAFSATFGPKEGKLSPLMSRLPAAGAAAAGVAAGPRDAVFALIDEVCDLYARSDASKCALIRGVVHEHEARGLLEEYIGHTARMLEQGGRSEWLTRGLAAASIDDQRRDSRDWLMSLGDVYLAARTHGIDPAPVLKQIAERSNPEAHRAAPTPTREALEGFEQSAYFGMSILPRLR